MCFLDLKDRPLLGPVLDISGIPALRTIDFDGRYYRIGAATSWRAVINADLPPAFDGLKEAAGEVGINPDPKPRHSCWKSVTHHQRQMGCRHY